MAQRWVIRWQNLSLRTKITGVTVIVLAFGLVVSGIGTLGMLRNLVLEQSDRKLLTLAQGNLSHFFSAADRPTNSSRVGTFDDVYIALYTSDGALEINNWQAVSTDLQPVVPAQLDQAQLSNAGANDYHVIGLKSLNGDEVFRAVIVWVQVGALGRLQPAIIAVSLNQADSLLRAYTAIFLGFGSAVVILGALLTWMLVTSTFAPLRRVERTAAAIADGDFSQRLDAETPNTEVGRLNRSLNQMLNRIDRAFGDRARTIAQMRRFVGDASHELRTPLVSVRGYAELYRMGALGSQNDVAAAMERIEKEAIRMSELVDDLLELARLDEAKPLRSEPVDLVPLARDAALDAHAIAPNRSITVVAPLFTARTSPRPGERVARCEETGSGIPASVRHGRWQRLWRGRRPAPLPSDPSSYPLPETTLEMGEDRAVRGGQNDAGEVWHPDAEVSETNAANALEAGEHRPHPFAVGVAMVSGEENKIRQVLTNLVANALRYTPDGSPIQLRIALETDRVLVDVVDHGEGIAPQVRDKIFERFWRADTSRTRDTGGTGLGLAIVQSIVQLHGGTVSALETAGGGATFRVSLPRLTLNEN